MTTLDLRTPEGREALASLGVTRPARTRRRGEARGDYHTRCQCGEEFTARAAEDRHLAATGHGRYEVVLP